MDPGEIVCLVGESGSGKSVIAHATMGLLPAGLQATHGEILLAGENLLAVDEARLQALRCTRMSMIFQEPMTALNPVKRVGDQIDEVIAVHTATPKAKRLARIIELFDAVQLPEPRGCCARIPTSFPEASGSAP